MPKILVISNDGVPDGYGRISMSVNVRLRARGYDVQAVSLTYDGLLPPSYDGAPLPYWVGALAQKSNWLESAIAVIHAQQPDIIMVIQDAPYADAIRSAPLDWSRHGFIMLTPVDGVPIHPRWVDLMKNADAALSISRFGVDAYRKAGAHVMLCRPGVDANTFFRLPDEARRDIRARLGIADSAFVVGTAAQNQGRKAVSLMLQAFFRFAADKPDARYLLDMEAQSPAGWDLPALCQQYGYDTSKLIFRNDAARMGVPLLRDRMNVMDAHMVIAHREGYGLPLVEAMACGTVSMALDYCSGAEICGDGKGVLIQPIDYAVPGTWGNAEDKFPDMNDLVGKLQHLHDHPHERAAIAERGMAWARQQTWDAAADAVQDAIERVMAKRRAIPPAQLPLGLLA